MVGLKDFALHESRRVRTRRVPNDLIDSGRSKTIVWLGVESRGLTIKNCGVLFTGKEKNCGAIF